MYDFDFWFAYFDSIFIKQKINIHTAFLSTLSLQQLIKLDFPECKNLPQISNCFRQFEKFILKQDNWVQSDCEHTTLKQIEQNINLILIVINVEKKYGREFWHSKRRIQSTICHFFSLFNYFLYSLIPNNLTTVQNSKNSNKLCTSLKKLQSLVNKILPQMNPIIKFLNQECFAEQIKLTIVFLHQTRDVLFNLPNLHRKKFKFQFQLTKYLCLITPIQISKNSYKFRIKRKKAATITDLTDQLQIRYCSQQLPLMGHREQLFQEHRHQKKQQIIINLRKKQEIPNFRTKFLLKKQKNSLYISQVEIQKVSDGQESIPILFQFSEKVRKYSFQLVKKKVTKTTLNTRQTLQPKFYFEKQRKKSQFAQTTNSHSKQKNMGRSFSIGKQRKMTNQGQMTNRSKESSFQQLYKSIQIQQCQKHRPNKQISPLKQRLKHQLSTKWIIKKPFEQIYPFGIHTKKIQLFQGKSKGWGIIQQDFKKKILKKKIHELICKDPK